MTSRLVGLCLVGTAALLLAGCPKPSTCGNGKVESPEQCDDGNLTSGDGCSSTCTTDGTGTDGGTAGCGNGVREDSELCDDGNASEAPCTSGCVFAAPDAYCGDGITQNNGEACDDGNQVSGDGCESDCTGSVAVTAANVCGDGQRQGRELCDDGNGVGGDGCENDCTPTQVPTVRCPAASTPAPTTGTCDVVAGPGPGLLIIGTVLQPGRVLKGGQVLVDAAGLITCAACDCLTGLTARPTTLLCGNNSVSPGLINGHDHLTFPGAPYVAPTTLDGGLLADGGVPERYEHRHDWRVGGANHDSHTKVSNGGGGAAAQNQWNELRQLMAGTTSISGSGGAYGLLRNLDAPDTSATANNQQGLGANTSGANYQTFPFGDSAGAELVGTCAYPKSPAVGDIPANAAYLPHIAEGIEPSARNEFFCMAGLQARGVNMFSARTAMIHGIGLKPGDIRFVALAGSSLIWSPRSNVSLYGETAQVVTYARMGVTISLGTDWVRSGSMNLLRELTCADYLNTSFIGRYFSDLSLWRMVTADAARAQSVNARVGTLTMGQVADLAIFKASTLNPYRAVLSAKPEDVLLTVRGGKVLYGDATLVAGLNAGTCEAVDVCGAMRSVCLTGEGTTLAAMRAANATTYPLFFCDRAPDNEPVCSPMRGAPWLFSGANAYTGLTSPGVDSDGDGLADAADNCPRVFNPKRPMDFGRQADADGDGVGDACDVCPLDANASTCRAPSATDLDGDGIPNATDLCVTDPDPSQTDTDGDQKGDACDPCPDAANPGTAACPPTPGTLVSIYDIKGLAGAVLGQKVQLVGALVTAVGPNGFFVQVHPADTGYSGSPEYSGLFVYYPGSLPRTDVQAGDRVTIPSGVAQDYLGQVQLTGLPAGSVVVSSRGNALPAPTMVTVVELSAVPRARALEGVVVQLASTVTVANTTPDAGAGDVPPFNEFTVVETTLGPQLRVNDFLYLLTPLPVLNEPLTLLRGVLQYRNANYKLEPRSGFDVVRPVALASLGPAGQYLRQGVDGPTFPTAVKVRLNSAQTAATPVFASVALADGGVAPVQVDAGLTVALGDFEAPLQFFGATAAASQVYVYATLGSADAGVLATTVRVLGANEQPTAVTLSPATLSVAAGSTGALTATLDVPAPAGGVVVGLSASAGADGGVVGTVPTTVTVPADQLSVSFDFTGLAAVNGDSTVTATVGGATSSSTVSVRTRAYATNLIISEYGEGNSNNKYIEIFNGTGAPVDLTAYTLQNFANGAAVPNLTLALTGTLADGDTWVVCQPGIAASFTGCDVKNSVIGFNGDDAFALAQGTTVIDVIGVIGMRPSPGWAVCGVANATTDTILIRKPSVAGPTPNWELSAGTSPGDCQWLASPATTEALMLANTGMGAHTMGP